MADAMVGERRPRTRCCRSTRCSRCCKDGETFSSSGYADSDRAASWATRSSRWTSPSTTGTASLIQQAFTRKAMERWEARARRADRRRAHRRVRATAGSADLVRGAVLPVPGARDRRDARAAARGPPAVPPQGRRADHASRSTSRRGSRRRSGSTTTSPAIIAERRADPRDDVISVLVQAELDGQRLTDDEIIAFLRLLLPAGAETTYRSSSNLMFGLLTNPDQLAALRDDRSLMPQAIEEGLRWEPPLTGIGRTATRDVEVEGVHDPGGLAGAGRAWARANRDPSRWDEPRRVRHPPRAAAAHGVRVRPAHVPRHAPRAHGDDRRDQPRARPPAEPAPRPRRRRRPHQRPRRSARPNRAPGRSSADQLLATLRLTP